MVIGTWSTRVILHGNGLHQLSKAVLQSDQAYYLLVFLFNLSIIGALTRKQVAIASTVFMLVPGVHGQMETILGSTYFSMMASAMACRVLRAVHLGHIKDPQVNDIRREPSAFYQ
jgi:hypothetical protein